MGGFIRDRLGPSQASVREGPRAGIGRLDREQPGQGASAPASVAFGFGGKSASRARVARITHLSQGRAPPSHVLR